MSPLEKPLSGATRTIIGGLIVDEVGAGIGRVKRVIYPPGWNWREQMQPVTGTEWCEHTHIGFIAQGTMSVEFTDGCTTTYTAPCAVITEAGHTAKVVGGESVVLIQVDCGKDTQALFALNRYTHTHTTT